MFFAFIELSEQAEFKNLDPNLHYASIGGKLGFYRNKIFGYYLNLTSTKMDAKSGEEDPCQITMTVNSLSLKK